MGNDIFGLGIMILQCHGVSVNLSEDQGSAFVARTTNEVPVSLTALRQPWLSCSRPDPGHTASSWDVQPPRCLELEHGADSQRPASLAVSWTIVSRNVYSVFM